MNSIFTGAPYQIRLVILIQLLHSTFDQLQGKLPYILDGGPCSGVESTILGFENDQCGGLPDGWLLGFEIEKVDWAVRCSPMHQVIHVLGNVEEPLCAFKTVVLRKKRLALMNLSGNGAFALALKPICHSNFAFARWQ
jgi:hypothetical protein